MGIGKVEVNNLNLGQGTPPDIERHLLYIGTTAKAELQGKVTRINAATDLDDVVGDDALGANLRAAQLNGKQNWTAAIYGLAPAEGSETWQDAIDIANQTDSFEGIAIVDPVEGKAEFDAMQAKAEALTSKRGRWVFILAAVPGIDAQSQSWADYETAMLSLVKDVAARWVVPVPMLNGNNIGALGGRLCDRSVTVPDSPMRVATGSVLGLGAMPVDSAGQVLAMSTIGTLAAARYSVPQTYDDYEGVYWSDAMTLETKSGDYQFLEYVRAVHKANRRIRFKAIARVADRILNSTPPSIERNRSYFRSVLFDMSFTTEIGGITFPGEIMTPRDEDVTIQWETKTKVIISIMVRPHNCPKYIVVNIALDLSNREG